MVCSRCGSQFEPGDNFCRNCGVRLSQSSERATGDESSRRERAQIITSAASSSRPKRLPSRASDDAGPARLQERKGIDVTIFFGVVLLIAVAAVGVYFGTNVLRQKIKADRPYGAEAPSSLSRKEMNRAGEPVENSAPSLAQSPEPSPSAPLEPSDQYPNVVSTPRPNTEASEPSLRKAPLQTDEQQSKGTARSAKVPASAPTSRRTSGAGAYETRDSTPLFESPSSSSRVVANIPAGTRVEVVSSKGDWLEVHSRRGNPPGFIRRQDAKFLDKTD
jgi:SH3 domain-containing protein/zinc ribbon protein